MRPLTLLLCSLFVFGQSSAPSSEPKAQPPARSSDQKRTGAVEILSDTKGVDFVSYIQRILEQVRENWYHLIPDCAKMENRKLAIEFAIEKDGRIADMRLVATSGKAILDRAAWGSIIASNPFPALPEAFTGPYVALRFRFSYNPDLGSPDSSGKGCAGDSANFDLGASRSKSKSGLTVSVTAPLPGDREVPLGGSKPVTAIVAGTGSDENAVEWSISGFGCSGASCGEMTKDSYHAPSVMPSSSFVTLTAVSKADPSAKASVTLHLVGSNPSR
jgi:TonB C terminal